MGPSCNLRLVSTYIRTGRVRGLPRRGPVTTVSTTLVMKPVRIAAARGPQTRRLGVSAHHTDALWNTVGSAGIAGNFDTTVNAPPDGPPPPIADENGTSHQFWPQI